MSGGTVLPEEPSWTRGPDQGARSAPTPPRDQAPSISWALLGCLLRYGSPEKTPIPAGLRAEHFPQELEQRVFRAVATLEAEGKPYDLPSVDHYLREKGLLASPGDSLRISAMESEAGPASSLPHYAEQLRSRVAQASIAERAERIVDLLSGNGNGRPPEAAEEVRCLAREAAELAEGVEGEPPPPAEELAPLHTFPRTDTGNAEIIAGMFGERLRFDHRQDVWRIFTRHHWKEDDRGALRQLAKEAARARLASAADCHDRKEATAVAKWALGSENRQRIDAALDLAKSERPIADDGTGWDADPLLLGVRNGVVDLRTGKRQAGRRADRITKERPAAFDPEAEAPRWEAFLKEVFAGEAELVSFVQRAIGYSLTGSDREQVLFMLYGSGANGKSTMLRTLRDLLGPYAADTPFSTLELGARATIPSDVAALAGKRLVTASETGTASRLNEARLKALTGGDEVTARFMYRDWFTFRPAFKLWLSVNHRPRVADTSPAFWRRVRLIPFLVRFEGDQADPDLEKKLRAESKGILAWAVRGALAWQQKGLEPPACVQEATADYRQQEDQLGDFLAERTEQAPYARAKAGPLYKAYVAWAEAQGLKERERLGSRTFGQEMGARFDKMRDSSGIWYIGIGLKEDQ